MYMHLVRVLLGGAVGDEGGVLKFASVWGFTQGSIQQQHYKDPYSSFYAIGCPPMAPRPARAAALRQHTQPFIHTSIHHTGGQVPIETWVRGFGGCRTQGVTPITGPPGDKLVKVKQTP